jgi:hypothetical protein
MICCPACEHPVSHHRTGPRSEHNAQLQTRCVYGALGVVDGSMIYMEGMSECPCQLHRDEATELRQVYGSMLHDGQHIGRFFRCDDQGEHFDFVATSLEHAQKILADSKYETAAESDKEFGATPLEWSELTFDRASKVFCTDEHGHRAPLTMWAVGMWFGSMFP